MSKAFEAFLAKAINIYGDRFEYNQDSYTRLRDPIEFTEKASGRVFTQIASNHLKSLPRALENPVRASRAFTKEQALSKLQELQPYLEFPNFKYEDSDTTITYSCSKHGTGSRKFRSFSKDSGCIKCSLETMKNKLTLTQEEFLEKVNSLYKDILDFSSSTYTSRKENIEVRCLEHGIFTTTPEEIFRGRGCPECHKSRRTELLKKDFFKVVKRKFPTYDFSSSVFTSLQDLISYNCPTHGLIETKAYSLYRGHECIKCSYELRALNNTYNTEEFLNVLETKPNPYNLNYYKVNYISTETPVLVECPKHGFFTKSPKNILKANSCPSCKTTSKGELELKQFLESLNLDTKILYNHKPKFMKGKELDIYIPEYNFAIEFNGTAYHHSSKSKYINNFYLNTHKAKDYHYNKWLSCTSNGINLLSIYDFYWNIPDKKIIYLLKIKYYLKLLSKIYARKCTISSTSKEVAKEFLDINHIEGSGFFYKDTSVYTLEYNNEIVMLATIGYLYNQSSKSFEPKLHRICTKRDISVIGGLSKLTKTILKDYPTFKYQIVLSTGGSTLKHYSNYTLIPPRYFWVSPKDLKFYHRNSCQKHLLEKRFKEPLRPKDTESTYMERLGYLKVYDNGLAELGIL